RFSFEKDYRRKEITDCNPLQHSRNPDVRQGKLRKACKKFAKQKDYYSSADDLQIKIAITAADLDATAERERNGDPDNKKEKRKDEIGWSPAVPCSVFQRPVDVRPGARIINQHHAGDGQTTKDIQRHKPARYRHVSNRRRCYLVHYG